MTATQCLQLTARADAQAKAETANIEGTARLGFRFESQGPGKHTFAPMADLRVKDHVFQPALGGVIVFVDPESMEQGYGTDIDFDGKNFVFTQSARAMPKVAEKTEEQKSEEKARRAATRASKGMAPGADKARVARAAKQASLAEDDARAAKKKKGSAKSTSAEDVHEKEQDETPAAHGTSKKKTATPSKKVVASKRKKSDSSSKKED